MKSAKLIGVIIGLLYLPLMFYLWYLLLIHINATELMWFVWIIGIPIAVIIHIIEKIIEEEGDE